MQLTTGTQTNPRRVFVDTQGWAEVFHVAGLHHIQATAFLQAAQSNYWELATSSLVVSELTPLLRSRNFRMSQSEMLDTVRKIRALPNLFTVHVDESINEQAWTLLYTNPQLPWSHVDATSMVIMRQIGVSEILTADHHFTQAGFTILL